MKNLRKHHSCEKYVMHSGMAVVVAVGGIGTNGVLLDSAEHYYISNGQWALFQSLPKSLGYGAMSVINNRLHFIGGSKDLKSERNVYLYNEETGWHLSNIRLDFGKFGHFSLKVNISELWTDFQSK